MSRGLPTAVANAVSADVVRPVLFVQCAFDSGNLNLWGGIGSLTAGGVTYVGAGTLLAVSGIKESTELQANGATVQLSGVTEPLLSKARDEDYQGRELKILLGTMDSSNSLISNPFVIFSGFMDTMTITDSGDTSTIKVTVENRLIEFERSRERRYTAEDQKIDYPSDKGLEFVPEIAEKEIVWGRPMDNQDDTGSSGRCLTAGTMVKTPAREIAIQNLKEGDLVIGADGTNKVISVGVFDGATHRIVKINNELIAMTSSHLVMTTEGWAAFDVEAAKSVQSDDLSITELKKGMALVDVNGDHIVITSIHIENIPVPVYTIKVDGDNTYIANNIITHNK